MHHLNSTEAHTERPRFKAQVALQARLRAGAAAAQRPITHEQFEFWSEQNAVNGLQETALINSFALASDQQSAGALSPAGMRCARPNMQYKRVAFTVALKSFARYREDRSRLLRVTISQQYLRPGVLATSRR